MQRHRSSNRGPKSNHSIHKLTAKKLTPHPISTPTRPHAGCGSTKNHDSTQPKVQTTRVTRELTPSLLKPRSKQAKFMATAPDTSQRQRGVFILLEGLDRSGKTTHAKHLVEILQTQFNIPAKYYPFPNRNTDTGKVINDFLQKKVELDDKQIHKLFTDNRVEVQEDLKNTLLSGVSIVADRYAYSGAAFSAAKGVEGMDLQWCFQGEVGLPAPDVVLYMNVSPEIAKKRGGFGQERYEVEEFQAKVRDQFDKIISLSPSWGEIEQQLRQQGQEQEQKQVQSVAEQEGEDTNESSRKETPTQQSITYLAPWYKVCSDDEFEEVAQRVQYIVFKVLEVQKTQQIHTISPFPQSSTTSNLENDFPKF